MLGRYRPTVKDYERSSETEEYVIQRTTVWRYCSYCTHSPQAIPWRRGPRAPFWPLAALTAHQEEPWERQRL
jgi:hypothetical protein